MGFKEELYKPFTEVDKRQGRGGCYDYIKWRHVADRMNEVFDGRWSSKVVAETVTATDIVVRIAVTVVDLSDSLSFTQEGYGGASIRTGEEAGTAHKSAYSKALKDACRKWGVGLYLDGDSDSVEPSSYIAPPKQMASPTGMVMPSPITQQSITPISSIPTQQPSPPAPLEALAPTRQAPAPPAMGGGMSIPNAIGNGMPAPIPIGIGGGMPTPISMGIDAGMAPPIAPPMAPINTQVSVNYTSQAPQQGSPAVVDAAPDEPATLTDVQKMAIVHMARARGAGTDEAVLATIINVPQTGISRTVPSIENLSYIEAVAVIKYIKLLNEKE